MKTILLGLVGAVVGVLLLIGIAFFWIRRKFAGFAQKMAAAMGNMVLTPLELRLEPAEGAMEWSSPEAAQAAQTAAQELENLGFAPAGRFGSEDQPMLRMIGLVHPQSPAMAVVYELGGSGVIVDVAAEGAERDLTFSSAPEPAVDRPEYAERHYLPGLTPAQLWAKMQDRAPEGAPVPAEAFAARFSAAYKRDMDWRLARGGYRLDEIRRVAAQGDTEATEDMLEQTHAMMQGQLIEGVEEVFRTRLLESGAFSAVRWDAIEDRLFYVHELQLPQMLAERLEWLEGELDSDDDDEGDAYEARIAARAQKIAAYPSRREAFRALLAEAQKELETLPALQGWPADADVYLMPEDEA